MKNPFHWICCSCWVVFSLCSSVLLTLFVLEMMRRFTHRSVCDIGKEDMKKQMVTDQEQGGPDCPDGWKSYGRFCYYFDSFQRDWQDAENTCISKGAHLASIHSVGEDCFVRRLIEEKNSIFPNYLPATWIGANDMEREGDWAWSDNTRVDYQQWHIGEPSSWEEMPEKCGSLIWDHNVYAWMDVVCAARQRFICKMDKEAIIK